MTESELENLIEKIRTTRCETQTVEIKSAHKGCPEKLYDTLSSFSNQNEGGVIVFGLDEEQDYEIVGVYDPQDLQKKVTEQARQMSPQVRPIMTVLPIEGKTVVSAEIAPIEVEERPCFHAAKGRIAGSYTRVGDADIRMTEYEVYSYLAFRKKLHDDVRAVDGLTAQELNTVQLDRYIAKRKENRPNLGNLPPEQLSIMAGITESNGKYTMMSLLLFGIYTQARFPQLCILATSQNGEADDAPVGERFADSKRIEGTLPEMLEGALAFVRNNMRVSIRINPDTGMREDVPQYPLIAVREAILNALVHRDYSQYTESMPICLRMTRDKLVITNPGGLYGRLTIDQLGTIQPDTRNQYLVAAMEAMEKTENRYSGIPCIRRSMAKARLQAPVFQSIQGEFRVTLSSIASPVENLHTSMFSNMGELLEFCKTPRSRQEIAAFLGISSVGYAAQQYIAPLVRAGKLSMTIPSVPRSRNQRFYTQNR